MTRPLVVYGMTLKAVPAVIAAVGSPAHRRQVRAIVATSSASEARRLFGVTSTEWRHDACDTGNDAEIAVALAAPGVVFVAGLDGGVTIERFVRLDTIEGS